jgi:anti-sigma factor RsiW
MENNCHYLMYAESFVQGELEEDKLYEFESHIANCAVCQNEIESLRRLKGLLNSVFSCELDETFNHGVVRNLRAEGKIENRKEVRIALEDIVISVATFLAIIILGFQLFGGPAVSPLEMSGTLTNIEKSSMEQSNISNDQVLELVLRSR